MHISINYVVVEKLEVPKKEGEFEAVQVEDDFVYKGKVSHVPEGPAWIGNHQLRVGDVVIFAKYSPDSHEITVDGKKLRFVAVKDLLAVV